MKRYQAQLTPQDWRVVDLLTNRVVFAGMNMHDAHHFADESNAHDYTPESWFR